MQRVYKQNNRGMPVVGLEQWRSQPDNLVMLCKFEIIIVSLFISLEIDCFLGP